MKDTTKALAIEALHAMREHREACVRSGAFDIEYKQGLAARATSPGVKTRATNELAVLMTEQARMVALLADTFDAIADIESAATLRFTAY